MAKNYKMLKPTNGTPPSWTSYGATEGAYYYVNGGSVKTYKKASVVITLPTRHKLKGTGKGRNAFISLGVDGGAAGPIDIGIRNRGLNGGGDNGYGWHPYCIECTPSKGYFYDGMDNPHQDKQDDFCAPAGTKKARVEVTPNRTNKEFIRLKVEWLDGNNNVIDNGKTFNREIKLSRTYNWTIFYRFASLVAYDGDKPSMSDSTYMLGGAFGTAKLGSASNTNWGINSSPVTSAYIINNPKCDVPVRWDVGEDFKIDHWA